MRVKLDLVTMPIIEMIVVKITKIRIKLVTTMHIKQSQQW